MDFFLYITTFNFHIKQWLLQRLRSQPFRYLLTFTSLSLLGMVTYIMCAIIHKIVTNEVHSEMNIDILNKDFQKIMCHSSLEDDGLPSINNTNFKPGPKSIFFHETSCRGQLTLRQGCSVESAARSHPKWQVYVLFNSPVSSKLLRKSTLRTLLSFPNVKVARIISLEYSKDTMLYSTVANQLWRSRHPVEHTADLMRIITLNKFGGVYLDLDQLVVKPFDDLPQNWVGKETEEDLGSGAMAFTRDGIGKNLTDSVISEIFWTFNPEGLTYNGPEAFQRVINRMCGAQTVNMTNNCTGIAIFQRELFYPISYKWAHLYFQNINNYLENNVAYTHHLWNMMTRIYTFQENVPFAKLAKKHCPSIYKKLCSIKVAATSSAQD